MRQKSTVYNLEYHNQFEGSKEDIRMQRELLKEKILKDKREGQSDFRIKKQTQKKG